MRKNYYALKASLPLLLFDAPPPFSRETFLEYCSAYLPEKKMALLRALKTAPRRLPEGIGPDSPTGEYILWEICLRNTLGALRAGKLGMDAESSLVKFAAFESDAFRVANEVYASQMNPLERERALDAARWYKLDSVEGRHTFDFEAFSLYLLRLMILEKWAARNPKEAPGNLDRAADRAEHAGKELKQS